MKNSSVSTRHKTTNFFEQGFVVLALLFTTFFYNNAVYASNPFYNNTPPKVTSSFDCAPTVNLAAIQPVRSGLWSAASTWPGGRLPNANDDVTIPNGRTVTLAGNCNARTITVNGTLTANTQATGPGINLRTKHIVVTGANARLQIGTKNDPYLNRNGCVITLTGTNNNEKIPGTSVNTKAIMVMNDAIMNLHGAPITQTWTKINVSANAGTKRLTFKDNVQNDWKVGDEIVIASSDFNMNEAEQHTISRFINANTVELHDNLRFNHFGKLQNYTHGKDQSINWSLDERAEVGLLSHNIRIQGDMSNGSLGKGYGGHIMIMNRGKGYVSGTELYHMGQRGTKGRYPFHWHGLRDASGQYFDRNSVHHTFNRAVTIHATSNVDVIGNVAYDNLGHAYFFEDGTETGVDMLFNLGLVTRRPGNQAGFLHSDTFDERNSSGPATFWITHPNNNINGNIAGGSDGSGIWFSPFNNPNGLYYDGSVNAHLRIPDGFMDNNISHSNKHGYIFGAGVIHGDTQERANQNGWIRPPANSNATVKDIIVYKNDLGVYHRTENGDPFVSTLINFIIADNRVGDATTWKTNYDRILWVTASDNFSRDYGGGGAVGGGTNAAHIVYDGPVLTKNSHFGGNTPEGYSLLDQWGANLKYTSHLFENTTTAPGAIRYNWRDGGFRNRPVWSLATVRDVDGAFSGRADSTISLDHPYLMDASSERKNRNGAQTDLKFAYVEIVPSNEGNNRPPASVLRADGPQYSDNGEIEGYPVPVVVNRPDMRSRFVLKREIPRSLRFRVLSLAAGEEIMIEVPNVPRSIRLGNVGQIANKSIEGLEASTANGVSWYWKDGTAYIKYKAGPGFVFTKSGDQANFSLCLNGNCNGGSNAVPIVLASFDERDTRGMVVRNGSNGIGISGITNSGGNDRYRITKQGGNDACAEYAIRFGAQNWRQMGRFNIQGAGLAGSEIYLYNSERKEQRRVGVACNNTRFTVNIPNNDGFYDNIAEISIKTCESRMSGNVQDIAIDRIIMGDRVGGPTAQNCGAPTRTDCNGIANGSAYRDDCGVCVGGNTGAAECNQAPALSFTSPSNTKLNEGDDLGVVVAAQGAISNVSLYLNDVLVRQEGGAPYEWGAANATHQDPVLLNLAVGTYVLKAVATGSDGPIDTITRTVTVTRLVCNIIPYININNGGWQSIDVVNVKPGDTVWFGPQSEEFGPTEEGWSWTGPGNITHNQRSLNLTNLQPNQSGTYTATNTDANGCKTSKSFTLNLSGAPVNTSPEVSFTSPVQAEFEAGVDLGVAVNATDNGAVAYVELYLGDSLVRRDTQAPYAWGTASANDEDPALLNLVAGTYILKAEATDDNGATTVETKTITVRSKIDPPAPPTDARPLSERLYVFDFDLPTSPLSDATKLVADLGYKGLTFEISTQANRNKYFDYLKTPEFTSGALSIPVGYYPYDFNSNQEQGANPRWKIAMNELPRNTDFWVIVRNPGATKAKVNSILTEMSAEATRLGKNVVIYPHYNNHIEGVEDALPYLEELQLDNLYVTFHLCHELREMNMDRLREVYLKARPYLKYVSISGALNEIYTNPAVADWSDAILPLDENEMDLFSYVQLLEEFNYQGPVFLHTFGINNAPVNRAPQDHLSSSQEIWKRLTTPVNIPGAFEAEHYVHKAGSVDSETTPGSGGQNLGFIQNGDYSDYYLNVAAAGSFSFDIFTSSLGAGGTIEIYSNNSLKGTLTVPFNGSWNNFEKQSASIQLAKGKQRVRLVYRGANGALFNIDRMQISVGATTPNPTPDTTTISFESPNGSQFDAGADLGVVVNVDKGTVSNIRLYINNDALVRQENVTPYQWGTAHPSAQDPAILDLAVGTYELKAVATAPNGKLTTITKTITVSGPIVDLVCNVVPYINSNNQGWEQGDAANVEEGDTVWFGPQSEEFGPTNTGWSWTGPNNFTFDQRGLLLGNLQANQAGTYTVTNTDANGCTASQSYTLNIRTSTGGNNNNNPIVHMRKRNAPNFALDGNVGGSRNQDVKLWQANPNNVNQQWIEIDRGNGYYSYQKVNTNYCMDGDTGGALSQNVRLWDCSATNQNQQWRKVRVADNIYRLEKRNASGFSIDGNHGGTNDQSAYLWESNQGNQNQHWIFEVVGSVATKESEVLNQLILHPNPVKNLLSVSGITTDIQVEVYDLLGSLKIRKQLGVNQNTIDFRSLASGYYLIRAIDLKDPANYSKAFKLLKR